MALTFTPPFTQTAIGSPAAITAAVTNRSTGAGMTTVVTGGANGTQVKGIRFMCDTLVAPPEARMWIYHVSGATIRLIGDVPIKAVAATTGSGGYEAVWTNPNTGIPNLVSGDLIKAGPSIYIAAATFTAYVDGAHY